MVTIELIYNPIVYNTSIKVNGESLSRYSELISYLRRPLYSWIERLFPCLEREINDDFMIFVDAPKFEFMIIEAESQKSELCISCTAKSNSVNQTDLFEKLNTLNLIDIKCEKRTRELSITSFAEYDASEIIPFLVNNDMFEFSDDFEHLTMGDNSFCDISLFIDDEYQANSVSIMVCDRRADTLQESEWIDNFPIIELVICGETSFEEKKGNLFVIKSEPVMVDSVIYAAVCSLVLAPLINELSMEIKGKENAGLIQLSEEERRILDSATSLEPTIYISCENHLLVGRDYLINISSYPHTDDLPDLKYTYSVPGVIDVCDGKMYALREGNVELCVYKVGEATALSRFRVFVENKILINEIKVPDQIVLAVDTQKDLIVDFSPENAQNYNEIELLSIDSEIIEIKGKTIVAVGCGNASIIVSTREVSATVKVTVLPLIDEIHIREGYITIEEGQVLALDYSVCPENAFDRDNLTFWSTNESVISVNNGRLNAKKEGTAKVIVMTNDNRVKDTCCVTVIKHRNRR